MMKKRVWCTYGAPENGTLAKKVRMGNSDERLMWGGY